VRHVEVLPLLGSGKIDYQRLKKLATGPANDNPAQ
jgi:hypothetical protein